MRIFRTIFCLLGFLTAGLAFAQVGLSPTAPVERLDPPKPLPPPGLNNGESGQDDLLRKRQQRRDREKSLEPPEVPYGLQQKKKLLKEALIPKDRSLVFEVSAVAGAILTQGDREGYTFDPSSHFNVFYRYDAKNKNGKAGPWFGFRLAPFAGTGFYKKRPGTYGLTYFGPMIGVGKINPVAAQEGTALRAEKADDVKIPSINGWLLGAGLAAVSKSGRTNEEYPDPTSDFASQGVAFDSPGIWIEGRYLKILFGAVGYNIIFGIQTGTNKGFIYSGIGFSGWD